MKLKKKQIRKENPPKYNKLLRELFFCKCGECEQTTSLHRHKIIQQLSKIENSLETPE